MATHYFEPMFLDPETGVVVVRWDGKDSLTVTCRIPVDADGNLLPLAEIKKSIVEQCYQMLIQHDLCAGKPFAELQQYVGQKIDVTTEFILKNVQ